MIITSARHAMVGAKFFERASDEILRPMQLRSEPAAKNQQKHARFACSGACSPLLCFCSRPWYSPARFSGNADFIGSPGAIGYQIPCKFPVLYRAEANNIGACKLRLCFCKLGCEKHRPKSARCQKSARIHPCGWLQIDDPCNQFRLFAKTNPTGEP